MDQGPAVYVWVVNFELSKLPVLPNLLTSLINYNHVHQVHSHQV